MSVSFDRYENESAIRLETRYARAWLLPAVELANDEGFVKQSFSERLAARQSQGYAEEDAATLALFDLTISRQQSSLTDARCLPKLIDIDLTPEVQRYRLGGAAFAPMINQEPGIYPIVDDLAMLEKLLAAGAGIIQLRIKSERLTPQIERSVRGAIEIARAFPGSQLFINDYWQAAIEHGAYGVHLGQEDLLQADLQVIQAAGLRLGVSSHAYWEVARALTIAPSYVACGPVFPTRAKVMPWMAQGIQNLAYWTALIPHPVIAIGGINAENLPRVCATGCACASVIQAIVGDADPAGAYQRLQQRWNQEAAKRVLTANASASIPIAAPTLTPAKAS